MKKNKFLLAGLIALASLSLSSCDYMKNQVSSYFGNNDTHSSMAPTPSSVPGPSVEPISSSAEVPSSSTIESTAIESSSIVKYDDFSVHFLELGNSNAGDCTYIKAGDVDILIDAGSRVGSSSIIEKYVDQFCTDKKLEYVIATHGDQDHIAAFGDTTNNTGIFSYYEVGTIIDFKYTTKTSATYKEYVLKRDMEITLGATHFYTDDLFGDNKLHSNVFQITDTIKMTILDQKFYHEKNDDENNHSVVSLFTVGDNHNFLFTGDLEKEGEESLVEKNPDLPKVHLFKGGHHGSKTSSNDVLLEKIQPEICCVCCCAGSSEYTGITDNQFPTQQFINRISKYTKQVYVTTVATYTVAVAEANNKGVSKVAGVEVGDEYLKTTGFKSLNGNINVKFVDGVLSVKCSNSDKVLKDSEWFNDVITLNDIPRPMRVWPSYGVQ